MKFKVLLRPRASKFLNKSDAHVKSTLINKIKELAQSPKLLGQHMKYCDFWKLRIGDYRAIYEIQESEKKVVVLFIGHRKDIYDNFARVFV